MNLSTCLADSVTAEQTPVNLCWNQQETFLSQSAPFIPVLLEQSQVKMEYRAFSADFEGTDALLDCFEMHNNRARMIYYPLIPSPCMCLCFKFGGYASQAVCCGATSVLSALSISPGQTVFCVRFRPGAADFFTTTSAKKLTNYVLPLNVFLPSTPDLLRELQLCRTFDERAHYMDRYVCHHRELVKRKDDVRFSRSMEMIQQRRGVLRVSELAEELSCSERYLCRMFNNKIGFSTKKYCELVQLQFSLREILEKHPKTLAKTAVAFGYFDLPHMNRIYQKFLGQTAGDVRYFNGDSCNMTDISMIL